MVEAEEVSNQRVSAWTNDPDQVIARVVMGPSTIKNTAVYLKT